MAEERKVPVYQSDCSLIEQEFDSIREKFDLEMRKMEEEMSRFRSQLISAELAHERSSESGQQLDQVSSSESSQASQRQDQVRSTSSSRRSTTTTRTTRRTTQSSSLQSSSEPAWMDRNERLASSPLVQTTEQGAKLLKLRFDVSQYEPEQIVVKTVDNRLLVHARREEQSENTSMYREYNREFLLPEGTEADLIRSSLSAEGVLTVEAPLAGLEPPGETRAALRADNLL